QVNSNSIKLTFDGAMVTADINKTGAVTTIRYVAPALLASGSSHAAKLEFVDTAMPPLAQSYALDFVVPEYALVSPAFATAPATVDKTKPGFKIRPYETEANNPDSLSWTEDQLAGLKGPNLANLAGADTNGYYARETVINFDIAGGAGNFPDDEPFPGLPGTGPRDGGMGNSAIEVLAFLEFPNPGLYVMGVNSDDGFRVTSGPNALDKFSTKLGEFDGTRGPLDTQFRILAPQAGIYPFRLFWESGGGGANVEWFTVNNGVKILVNDTNSPDSIKAYREGSTRAYVKTVSPLPNAVDVPATNSISIVLADGTLQVQDGSIQLFLNGQHVDPTKNSVGGITTVTYTPPTRLAPESTNTVRLVYADNASPPNVTTNEFSFIVAPDIDVLIGVNQIQQWRYNQAGSDLGAAWKEMKFDDSSWASGLALFEGKTGTVPSLPEPVRTTLTIGSGITTYYFRTHFNFTGNPGGARLRLRYIIDDGAVFYLNGTEIYRVGMPNGPITASKPAALSVGDAVYEGPVDLPVRSLVAGDNAFHHFESAPNHDRFPQPRPECGGCASRYRYRYHPG
ncbi:MAG: hypothetical protein DMG78_31660, partial [Acidobacteria bacterium]